MAKSHRANTGGLHGTARGDHIAATLGKRAWNRYSAGDGAKGPREFDWACVAVIPPIDEATGFHWLLIRRRITDGELAFYLAVQQGVGEGHDQYTDDMFTTHEGRLVAVSRPSFADVPY